MNLLDHCGPIVRRDVGIVVDANGIALAADVVEKSDKKSGPWVARWIWLDTAEYPEFQDAPYHGSGGGMLGMRVIALFRKEIDLDVLPRGIPAWVTASSKYRLYVNGRMVSRGPAEHGGDIDDHDPPAWWFYDPLDLTGLFHVGRNVITVEVSLYPDVGADYSLGHGGFLFEANIDLEGDKSMILVSDKTWRARVDDARLLKAMHDAREDPGQWHDPSFDASGWLAASELPAAMCVGWNIIARQIPPLLEVRVAPVTVHCDDDKRITNSGGLCSLASEGTSISCGIPVNMILEFDREVVGYLQFCMTAPAGVQVQFGYQERMGKDDDSDLYITKAGFQAHEAFRLRGFQYLRVAVDFKDTASLAEPFIIHFIGVNFTSYPVRYKGEFSCSDPLLDKIWVTGRWTEQLCMQAYHLDSPIHQEPLGDTGDYIIESLIDYACFGDARLVRLDLLRTAYLLQQKQCSMFHTSYSLLFVQMLREYHDYTSDVTLVHDLLPTVNALLDRFSGYVGESGLVTEAPNYMFMDWITVDSYNLHHPPCTIGQGYMSAFYYKALQNAAHLNVVCQDKIRAEELETKARALKVAFNAELWEPGAGLYCDGRPNRTHVPPSNWMPPDPVKTYVSRHTNALAVAYGLAPDVQARSIVERIMNDPSLPVVQPYFMHFMFDALVHAGLFDTYGLREIRRWKCILDEHPSSWKESWGMGDYSHAWSGTPTYQLSARVLGVAPGAPGFATIIVHPRPGDLTWARGVVPVPAGLVAVSWSVTTTSFTIDIDAPETCHLLIVFPDRAFKHPVIRDHDRVVWKDGVTPTSVEGIEAVSERDGAIFLRVNGGKYKFCESDS